MENIQVALLFVLSFLFSRNSKNSTALIASFLVILFSIIFSLNLTEMFKTTNFYFLWVPFVSEINFPLFQFLKLILFINSTTLFLITKYLNFLFNF